MRRDAVSAPRGASRVILGAAALWIVMTGLPRAEEFRRLPGSEIAAMMTGAEFTDEIHWSYVFERGGRLVSVVLGTAGTGAWRVEGDELCTRGGPGTAPCHQVWIAGPRMQLRRSDEVGYPEEGILKRSSGTPAKPRRAAPR